MMDTEIKYGLHSYFTFRLGAELFGVNIGQMTKILEMTEITKVPDTPGYFKGLINHSGDVLPVIDARLKFGFPEAGRTRNTCILVLVFDLDGQAASAGIIVDSVERVAVFGREQILPASAAGKNLNSEYMHGVAVLNDEYVIMLNLEKIFAEEEICLINAIE